MKSRLSALVLSVAAAAAAWAGSDQYNLLFYGNSFTIGVGFGSTRSVNALVSDIAVAAGKPQPFVRAATAAGQSLEWHRTNNTAVITTGIPAGQNWDFVILQDHSTQPTHIGSLALHRSSFTGLYSLVRNHSPNVTAIGFETWARAPGHSFYLGNPPLFPGGPTQMQQELRDGYMLSNADTNALYGDGASRTAAVGDAWENANWQSLHGSDLYHAQNRGTLLAAMMIYGTIYQDNTISDINLAGVLNTLGLTPADGEFLSGVADATLPEPASALLVLFALAIVRRR